MHMEEKSRRAEYADATRQALIDAARELFAERGYNDTSTEEVVQKARVTRGALYHHFPGKAELFRAVYEQLELELVTEVMEAAYKKKDPWDVLLTGMEAFLDACMRPEVVRIALREGPSVLSWEDRRELEDQYGLGPTKAALEEAMRAGAIQRSPVDPLAYMLLGALHQGALYVAGAEDSRKARRQVGSIVRTLLEHLRP
jgi:AcrR family transcriptional regulator